jgi:hypothetical protein
MKIRGYERHEKCAIQTDALNRKRQTGNSISRGGCGGTVKTGKETANRVKKICT